MLQLVPWAKPHWLSWDPQGDSGSLSWDQQPLPPCQRNTESFRLEKTHQTINSTHHLTLPSPASCAAFGCIRPLAVTGCQSYPFPVAKFVLASGVQGTEVFTKKDKCNIPNNTINSLLFLLLPCRVHEILMITALSCRSPCALQNKDTDFVQGIFVLFLSEYLEKAIYIDSSLRNLVVLG